MNAYNAVPPDAKITTTEHREQQQHKLCNSLTAALSIGAKRIIDNTVKLSLLWLGQYNILYDRDQKLAFSVLTPKLQSPQIKDSKVSTYSLFN